MHAVLGLLIFHFACFSVKALGFHIDSKRQFDLIEGLGVLNNTYRGLTVVEGIHHLSPAVLLKGDSRHLKLPSEMLEKISKRLSETNEFCFMATLKQEEKNTGTIISFSEGNDRFLELQSSGRKDEIRLHYTHANSTFVETFRYHLTDNNYHLVALSVSGNTIDLYVDCSRIYRRIIDDIDYNFASRNISLWLGQRNAHHFMYKGYLQDVKIAAEAHGYTVQCPDLDTDCPTCGQFKQLQKSVQQLENYIEILTKRLEHAENHISHLSECECEKSCSVNDTRHPDGSTWTHGCEICSCVHGEVKCLPVSCNVQCKNPVHVPGECCHVCLKKCLFENTLYEHGEETHPLKCVNCTCINGNMQCRRIDPETSCPHLNCPKEEQFSTPDECCNFCRGVDYCGKGHDCHYNASCMNLNTHYKCQCNRGFDGDGRHCEDIDECQREGGHDGHHCRDNTVCVNLRGDYVCECLPGYERADKYNCVEIDECTTGQNTCDENALCINTAGSYTCQCFDGYSGNGHECDPVCSIPCLNGGRCIAPEMCSCLHGYTGLNCEIDVDECSLGLHMCHPNSQCINMPGWYYCQCIPGYESRQSKDNLGAFCQDIDECLTGSHTCDLTALCVNNEGGYHCECMENSSCSLSCLYFNEVRLSGEVWFSQSCTRCRCTEGVVSCQPVECDCTQQNINLECCPHCDHSSVCQHQESSKSFHNGDQWIFQCQTCECLHREIDCWDLECPPVQCEHPVRNPGDCCERCDDDPCNLPTNTTPRSDTKGCAYNGVIYKPGEKVPLVQDPCSSCHCQDGFLCCKYNSSCIPSDDSSTSSSTFLRINDTARNNSDSPNENSEVDQKIFQTNYSMHTSKTRRLLSVLFPNSKNFSHTNDVQKSKGKSQNSLKNNNKYTPVFGKMKLTSQLNGAFVKGANAPGPSFDSEDNSRTSFPKLGVVK